MSSKYQIFQGNKRIEPTGTLPLIVITGQRDAHGGFGEHYIFTGSTQVSSIRGSTAYGTGRSVDQPIFDRFVTLESILRSQLEFAKAHLENAIFQHDKNAYRQMFWEGNYFEYKQADESAFYHLVITRKWKKEIAEMFETTQCTALDSMEDGWKVLNAIDIRFE